MDHCFANCCGMVRWKAEMLVSCGPAGCEVGPSSERPILTCPAKEKKLFHQRMLQRDFFFSFLCVVVPSRCSRIMRTTV